MELKKLTKTKLLSEQNTLDPVKPENCKKATSTLSISPKGCLLSKESFNRTGQNQYHPLEMVPEDPSEVNASRGSMESDSQQQMNEAPVATETTSQQGDSVSDSGDQAALPEEDSQPSSNAMPLLRWFSRCPQYLQTTCCSETTLASLAHCLRRWKAPELHPCDILALVAFIVGILMFLDVISGVEDFYAQIFVSFSVLIFIVRVIIVLCAWYLRRNYGANSRSSS